MKIRLTEDLTPVTEFRVNSAKMLQKVRKTRRPMVLTQRGRSAAVLEDVREYENRLERLELLEKIVRGMQAADRGDLVPHEEVLQDIEDLMNE